MQTVAAQLPDTGLMDDLARLLGEDSHQADDLLTAVCDDEALHDDAVALRVVRDGTRLRRHDDKPDGQVTEPGWRVAPADVVAQLSNTGEMRTPCIFARLPEPGRAQRDHHRHALVSAATASGCAIKRPAMLVPPWAAASRRRRRTQ
ncbi:MAG: hypothetical protein OXE84_13145 [Rhodobacteraceae bacterium]|nr:hypothetical protein [Paracoccaceae bacterium]MCY4197523.1 hypothetical protein [Paracoccaceae bacterium]